LQTAAISSSVLLFQWPLPVLWLRLERPHQRLNLKRRQGPVIAKPPMSKRFMKRHGFNQFFLQFLGGRYA
jgi:hypothetical protein